MIIRIRDTEYEKKINTKDESTFWQAAFTEIFDHYDAGQEAVVIDDDGEAVFVMEEDGLRAEMNGIRKKKSEYPVKKLRKIDAETGQHLFYDIIPNNMGPMTMDVGFRYGNTGGVNAGADLVEGAYVGKPFYSYLYWGKYLQLIRKGYKDYTDEVYDAEEEIAELEKLFGTNEAPKSDENETVLRVANFLGAAAKDMLSSQINVDWMSSKPPFNKRQVTSARKAWNSFRTVKTVNEANSIITKLIGITDVSFKEGKTKLRLTDFLITDTGDPGNNKALIDEQIDRWDSIIMAMEATLPQTVKKGEDKKVLSPFGDVEMEMASEEETSRIRDKFKVGKSYHIKLVNVTSESFNARTDKYIADNGITKEEEFIHGSRTSNWPSIIKNGLLLNPDAPITGKAYGYGIYTARDFAKSLGYTDYCGSKWAGGTGDVGVIGVYRTAYGKPLYPDRGINGDYAEQVKKAGCNCLDVLVRYSGYRMDEIVFYDEEALSLEKLMFFSENEDSLDWLF